MALPNQGPDPVPTPRPAAFRPAAGPSGREGAELPAQLLALLRAELRKTYSTSIWWALLIPAALLSLLVNLVTAQGANLPFGPALAMALALGSFSAKLAVVYGVVSASGEFRHRTITTSYLTAPGRPLLITAKALVAALVGAVYAAVCSLVGLLGALFGGGLSDGQAGSLLAVCAASVVTFALWAVLGVGVAMMLANQLVAIVGVLVYLMLVEQILVGLAALTGFGEIEEYLPGGSGGAVLTGLAGDDDLAGSLLTSGVLPWWLALVVFAGYAAVAVLAGAAVAQRRDIT
ncbi:MAG: hypothetical protein ACT4O0_05650 [Pseudonocardia sp.]|jgi:ABC-2 type transport system permease protein